MMRVVIDLQGAQSVSSRFRGIGRYGLSFAQGLARNRGDHEVFVALNGEFSESISPIRAALQGLVPPANILVWEAPGPNHSADPDNKARRQAAELIRESALASLKPDYVVITSMFEGWGDNAVTSIGQLSSEVPTAAILFDLIPLIHRDIYLSSPTTTFWYENKLSQMRNATLLLTISESSRQEAIDHLGVHPADAVNISTAAEECFTPAEVGAGIQARLAQVYGLTRPFVMYTGGIDHRKNIEGLIEAFAALPKALRSDHQLAIVCAIQDVDRQRLLQLARGLGLEEGQLVLTGFVPEPDLIACYRLCKLFVFPSWHEGFGLPVLEAMMCGTAVIASNRSSLPEVVGLESALFDPFDLKALSDKIAEVLTNDRLRERLERHGLEQAKEFSWDKTTRRAWAALEESDARRSNERSALATKPARRPRMAFLSPLPPGASGIADYSAELLPELARHYRIDVVVAQDHIADMAVVGNYPVRDVAWFREHAHEFDRILYNFGNSDFHTHMFDLLRDHPGVVVLHDFYLSGISHFRDATGLNPNGFAHELLEAHGWPAVVQRFKSQNVADVIWTYPCNTQVIQDSLGVIVHADYPRQLAQKWYGCDAAAEWHHIPLLRRPLTGNRAAARETLGIVEDDFIVCSLGFLGLSKLNDRLLSAWLDSPLARDPQCHLVFVGKNDAGEYGKELERSIRSAKTAGRIEITGWTDKDTYRQWLAAADMGVQLRTLSRGETSAAVLDCMNAGMATIVNANGSMAELPDDCVWLLKDDFTDADLAVALDTLRKDHLRRRGLAERAQAYIRDQHSPRGCGNKYALAIEQCYSVAATGEVGLEYAIVEAGTDLKEKDWEQISTCLAQNLPRRPRLKRILVDVSDLVLRDSLSSMQRVLQSILTRWLLTPPAGWIVEAVYADKQQQGFRYARRYTSRLLDIPDGWCKEDWVDPVSGDIFLGLDLQLDIVSRQLGIFQDWYRRGVGMRFVVDDLLPVTMPELVCPQNQRMHHEWLSTIAQFDGVVCISRAVADGFCEWLDHYGPERSVPLAIDWFHVGGDTENSVPTRGLPDNAELTLSLMRESPSFLTVGTIEPRKGLRQVLAAFERLWAKGGAVNLVIVGKLGWMMDDFADQLRDHPQYGKKVLWLESISDEYLELVYASCRYLIAASEDEGFGLPLIEAARHGLPVLARDIPVFREVAGKSANYFADNRNPKTISDAIARLMRSEKEVSKPVAMSWQTSAQSADALLEHTFAQEDPYKAWMRDDKLRMWGSDIRLRTVVGTRDRKHLRTSGRSGFLTYGPYLPIAAQTYRFVATGDANALTGTEFIELISSGGVNRHWHGGLRAENGKWSFDELISIEKSIADFEIRIWVEEKSKLSLSSIVLTPQA